MKYLITKLDHNGNALDTACCRTFHDASYQYMNMVWEAIEAFGKLDTAHGWSTFKEARKHPHEMILANRFSVTFENQTISIVRTI